MGHWLPKVGPLPCGKGDRGEQHLWEAGRCPAEAGLTRAVFVPFLLSLLPGSSPICSLLVPAPHTSASPTHC